MQLKEKKLGMVFIVHVNNNRSLVILIFVTRVYFPCYATRSWTKEVLNVKKNIQIQFSESNLKT